jgi:uncharacterized membrane protein YbhN (UPF0104 family)
VTLDWPAAHAVALALVVADVVARALRLNWMLRGAGTRISLWETVVINAFGDAAAALTPLRIGGHPARFVGLLHAGVPGRTALPALAVEAIVTNAVVVVCTVVLAVLFAPEWWAAIGPRVAAAGRRFAPWIAGLAVLSLLLWLAVRRRRAALRVVPGGPAGSWLLDAVRAARGLPASVVLAAVPLSVVNVFGRVLVLPVLALTLPDPPGFGTVTMGSFALVYGQIVLPTPSGAGAVELGFLAGAAGELGAEGDRLLFFWRLYTSILPVLFGIAVSLPKYGRSALLRVLRGERVPSTAGPEAPESGGRAPDGRSETN